MDQQFAKWMILGGISLTLSGVIFYLWSDKLHFIGNLPGDFKIERDNFKFYFPLTTMILLGILVNILSRLWRYFQ